MEPRKSASVSLAGWAALCLALLIVAWYLTELVRVGEPEPDPLVGALVLVQFVCFSWWFLGTLIHRSRVNRMRYLRHAVSAPEFPPAEPGGRANPWRPWEG